MTKYREGKHLGSEMNTQGTLWYSVAHGYTSHNWFEPEYGTSGQPPVMELVCVSLQ